MSFDPLRLLRSLGRSAARTAPAAEPPAETVNPAAAEVALELSIDGAPAAPARLFDLDIRGARVLVPFHLAPGTATEQDAVLDLSHEAEGWSVRAHAVVRRLERWDDRTVIVEVEFDRVGDLYAQLDDALGRYFDRRLSGRVTPGPGERVGVRLALGRHRVRGGASDLSTTGLCVRSPLAQAATLRHGDRVRVRVGLPGVEAEVEAPGFVRHARRAGEDVLVGIEFDLSRSAEPVRGRTEYLRYIGHRWALEAVARSVSRQSA